MNYAHYAFNASSGDTIEVTLDGQANVLLLDSVNYQNYRSGRRFSYQGGLAKVSPVNLIVPRSGNWHVVINLGGYSGTVRSSARLIQ